MIKRVGARIFGVGVLGVVLAACSGERPAASSAAKALIGTPVITPSSGAPGDTITISGTRLGVVMEGVYFQNSQTVGTSVFGPSLTKVNDDSVTVVVPAGALTGPLVGSITIDSSGAQLVLGAFSVTSLGAPTIVSIAVANNVVTVNGTNLSGTTAVSVGGTAIPTFKLAGDAKLTFSLPPGSSGTVMVTNSVGNATSVDTATYVPRPSVTGVSPLVANEGASITIDGTLLDTVTTIFCGSRQLTATTQTANQITLLAPIGTYGCTLSLASPAGSISTPYLIFVPTTAPTVSGYTPTSGPVGTSLILSGTNLGIVTSVELGGWSTTGSPASDGLSYTVQIGAGALSGVVKVHSPLGTLTLAPNLTVDASGPTMRIDSVVPSAALPGDTVTIHGANFPNEALTVYLQGGNAPATWVDASTLTFVAPTFVAQGIVYVESATLGTASGGYLEPLQGAPTLTSVSPSALVEGEAIEIFGTNLLFAQAVRVGSLWLPPYQTALGKVVVKPPYAIGGTVEIEVVTRDGSATISKTFDALKTPTITSFSPTTVAVGGVVTIVGTNLDVVDEVEVYESNVSNCAGACTSGCLCIVSPTTATFVAWPESAPSVIRAYHPGGEISSSQVLTVNDGVPPIITHVSSTTIVQGRGTVILGDHFSGVLRVEIGGQPVPFRLVSNDVIRIDSLSFSASGKIKIVTVAGSVESVVSVQSTDPLFSGVATVTGVSPSEAGPGQTVVVTGTGLSAFTKFDAFRFNGGRSTEPTTVVSDTEVRLITPTEAFQSLALVSANARLPLAVLPKAAHAPVLTGITPQQALPGQTVVLLGSGLFGLQQLVVGGQVWGPQAQLALNQFRVPFDAVSGTVVATNALGSSAATGPLTVGAVTTTLTLSPTSATPGQTVLLTGTGAGNASVTFSSGSGTSGRRIDADTLELTVPTTASTGVVRVGTFASTTELRVLAAGAPIVDSVVPDDWDRIVVGRNFTGTRRVSIGGTALPFEIWSDRELRVELPSGLSNLPLVVENALGRTVSTFTLAPERARVTSISTTTASVGDVVTLTGTNLHQARAINIEGQRFEDTPLVQISATQASFVVHRGVPSGRLLLYYDYAWDEDPIEVAADFVVNAPAAPVVAQEVTVIGPPLDQRGFAVRGANFTGLLEVTVAGVRVTNLSMSDTEIEANVPDGAGSGPIVVRNSAGQVTAGQYTAPDQTGPLATLTSVSPALGAPGTRVVLEGTNLDRIRIARVGGVKLGPTVPGKLRALGEVPLDLPSGEIELVMYDGRIVKTGRIWTTLGRLALLDATPITAAAGAPITVTGDGFWGTTSVTIGGVSASFVVTDGQTLVVTAPDEGASGTLVVTTDDDEQESAFSLDTTAAPDLAVPVDLAVAAADLGAGDDGGMPSADMASSVDAAGAAPDLATPGKDKSGCSVAGSGTVPTGLLILLALLVGRRRARRRAGA